MKWYKHLAGSLNNFAIFEAIEKFGSDGYLVFFGTLEIMTDEFDITNPGVSKITIKKLTKSLQLSRRKTLKILEFFNKKAEESLLKFDKKMTKNWQISDTFPSDFQKKAENIYGFFVLIEKDYVIINCPRLKELCDEWTKKQLKKLRSDSGATPDSLPPKEVRSKNKEKEKEEKEKEKSFSLPKNNFDDEYQKQIAIQKRIVAYLNEKAEKDFPLEIRLYPGHKNIIDRLEEEFYLIIDKKVKHSKAKKDPFSRNSLRTDTLFTKDNFYKYLYEDLADYEPKVENELDEEKKKRRKEIQMLEIELRTAVSTFRPDDEVEELKEKLKKMKEGGEI